MTESGCVGGQRNWETRDVDKSTGIQLSRPQVYRVVHQRPERVSLRKPRDCCPQHPADELDRELIAISVDERRSFRQGGASSAAKNADADFKISLARGNSRFSRLSRRISVCSELVIPGRSPASIWGLRRHRRTDSCTTPSLLATDLMASNSENIRGFHHGVHQPHRTLAKLQRILTRHSIQSSYKDRNKPWGSSRGVVRFLGSTLVEIWNPEDKTCVLETVRRSRQPSAPSSASVLSGRHTQ